MVSKSRTPPFLGGGVPKKGARFWWRVKQMRRRFIPSDLTYFCHCYLGLVFAKEARTVQLFVPPPGMALQEPSLEESPGSNFSVIFLLVDFDMVYGLGQFLSPTVFGYKFFLNSFFLYFFEVHSNEHLATFAHTQFCCARAGRTARMGKPGTVTSIVSKKEFTLARCAFVMGGICSKKPYAHRTTQYWRAFFWVGET